MSRTIELRCWSEHGKCFHGMNELCGKLHLFNNKNPIYVIEQFTGLLDSNRVKIFEGDILKFDWLYQKNDEPYCDDCVGIIGVVSHKGRFVCDFFNGGMSFNIYEINQNTFERFFRDESSRDNYGSEFFKMVNFEVIGNIHENPELINSQP